VVDGVQEEGVQVVEILGIPRLHILENGTITASKRDGDQDSGLVRQLAQLRDTWLAIGANSNNSRFLPEEVDGSEEGIAVGMMPPLDGVGQAQTPLQDMKVLDSDLLQEDRFFLVPSRVETGVMGRGGVMFNVQATGIRRYRPGVLLGAHASAYIHN
jgi:hypothetical protein